MAGNRVVRGIALGILTLSVIADPARMARAQGPDDRAMGRWEALAARSAVPVAMIWNASTGTPASFFGAFSEAGAVSERRARRFLTENAELFKLADGARDLVLVRDLPTPMGRHLVFEQRFGGLPVQAAEVKVHYNREGRVVGVSSTYKPGIALDSVEAAVPFARAVDAIAQAGPPADPARPSEHAARSQRLAQALPAATGSLVVYVGAGSARLAWKVHVPSERESWEAFVDARTGELVGPLRDINRYVSGTGQVFRVNAVVATQDNTLRDDADAASAVPASAYSIVILQGLDGTGFLDGTYASSGRTKKRVFDAGGNFVFDRGSDGFSETMGYYYFDYAQRYVQSLGFTNVNNRQQVFSVNRFKPDNSFYSPNSREITLGLGGVDDAEDADVIWHEYGHSIQDDQVPGFGSTLEAGSMGEGFGDYLAGTLGAPLSDGFQDECIAEWDATSYSSAVPPCLRRLDGTKHYPEDVQGEVHRDGEIWSAALWQIRGAIGATKADQAILQHHFLISAEASFNEAANALVTAAVNLGCRRAEVNRIRTILSNRGFTVTA